MLQCKKCGTDLSGRTDITTGFSNKINPKTGKAFGGWRGVKCSCGNMEFLPKGKDTEIPTAPQPQIQQSKHEVKLGPSVDTKLDILNKQLHDIAIQLKKLDTLADKLDRIDSKIVANHEAAVEVGEMLSVKSPDQIAWEE
jgi:hypothetical protein